MSEAHSWLIFFLLNYFLSGERAISLLTAFSLCSQNCSSHKHSPLSHSISIAASKSHVILHVAPLVSSCLGLEWKMVQNHPYQEAEQPGKESLETAMKGRQWWSKDCRVPWQERPVRKGGHIKGVQVHEGTGKCHGQSAHSYSDPFWNQPDQVALRGLGENRENSEVFVQLHGGKLLLWGWSNTERECWEVVEALSPWGNPKLTWTQSKVNCSSW